MQEISVLFGYRNSKIIIRVLALLLGLTIPFIFLSVASAAWCPPLAVDYDGVCKFEGNTVCSSVSTGTQVNLSYTSTWTVRYHEFLRINQAMNLPPYSVINPEHIYIKAMGTEDYYEYTVFITTTGFYQVYPYQKNILFDEWNSQYAVSGSTSTITSVVTYVDINFQYFIFAITWVTSFLWGIKVGAGT